MPVPRHVQPLARIREWIQLARQRSASSAGPERDTLRGFEILPGRLDGQPVDRAVVALRTRGCLWFRGRGKACAHCGLVSDGLWDPGLDEDMAFGELSHVLSRVAAKGCPILCLYVAGSFFDDLEITPESRQRIVEVVTKISTIRRLVVECRPELIKPGTIAPTVASLGEIELEVGLGFDSLNPDIRSLCLNKQTKEEQFARAAMVVREEGARLLTYLVLKPPFVNERAAIDDAVATGRYAFAQGASAVSVEPLAVQVGTLAQLLWEHGLFRSPWLWSLVEVLRALAPLGEVRAGGVVVYPSANRYPSNCAHCSERVFEQIQRFNVEQDLSSLEDLGCICRNDWRNQLQDSTPLLERIARDLAALDEAEPGQREPRQISDDSAPPQAPT